MRDPLPPSVVFTGNNFTVASSANQRADRCPLVESVFQQQMAAGLQATSRVIGQGVNGVESVDPGGERDTRLKTQIAAPKVGIALGDVRRIAHQYVDDLVAERREPAAGDERNTFCLESRQIALSDGKRRQADVGGDRRPP